MSYAPKLKMVDVGGVTHASRDLERTFCGLTAPEIKELKGKEAENTRKFCTTCMNELIKEHGNES